METDAQTGEPVLVGWNGDNPTAEIFRLRVRAVSSYIVIDSSNPDSEDAYTPNSIVGDPLNSKESCVLIDSNTGRAWTRTCVSATTATFSTDLVVNNATLKQIGRQTWDYNSNTGKVVENAVWTASINDNVTTPDSTEDLESITVDYLGTTIKYEAKAGAGRIIFNTNSTGVPYSWNTGSRAVTAKDEEGNTLTSAEVIAKIEAGAAIQVIATVTDPNVIGNYTPNKIQIIYDSNYQTYEATIGGIAVYFMSSADYVNFHEGRRLFINLRQTNVTGIVYKEQGKMIDELSNVDISYPIEGNVLTYNGTNWVNGTVNVGGGVAKLQLDNRDFDSFVTGSSTWCNILDDTYNPIEDTDLLNIVNTNLKSIRVFDNYARTADFIYSDGFESFSIIYISSVPSIKAYLITFKYDTESDFKWNVTATQL